MAVACGRASEKIWAPPMIKTLSFSRHKANAAGRVATVSVSAQVCPGVRLMMIFLLPGSGPGSEEKVFLPMMIGWPMVVFLKKISSSGICHGVALSRPITLLAAMAAIRIISMVKNYQEIY